jgi:hypothetical protein
MVCLVQVPRVLVLTDRGSREGVYPSNVLDA